MKRFLPILLFIGPSVSGAEEVAMQTEKKPLTGKHVTLRYGDGFNVLTAMGIRDSLIDEGCPAELRGDWFIPKTINISVAGKQGSFTSLGSAGSFALRNCKAD